MPLITFEGIDGSGKSTLLQMTKEFLEANGRNAHVFKEPGGTVAGEMARDILLNTDEDLHPLAQLMLFQFSRAQLVNTLIAPLVADGEIVLLDRYIASTIAYQGYAQGKVTKGLSTEVAKAACEIATCGLMPDMEIYLDVDLNVAYHRMKEANSHLDNYEKDMEFMGKAQEGYDVWYGIYCMYPNVRLDANQRLTTIHTQILEAIWSKNDIIK